MVSLSVISLACSAVLSVAIGSLVLARNKSKTENLAFFGISLGIFFWAVGIASFIQTHDLHHSLGWAKFYYFAPLLVVYSSVIFAQYFLSVSKFSRFINLFFAVFGLGLAGLLFLDKTFITEQVIQKSYGKQVVLNKYDYIAYSCYLLLCFMFTILLTYRKARQADHTILRQQANLFLIGYVISATLGVFFNLILPGAGDYKLIALGPLLTTIFLLAVSYAIVRHKLFDVRLVVARTLAYVATLIVLAGVYGFLVFGIINGIFKLHISFYTQVFLSATTGLVALFFGDLRKIFDHVTNRIFYRDAYDPQTLFDHLNRVLISTLDLNKLIKESTRLIADNLKSEYCVIGLKASTGNQFRIIGTESVKFDLGDIALVRGITPKFHTSVISTDYLDDSEIVLKNILIKNKIALLVRLAPHLQKTEEGLGYIVLGFKKSGNPYTNQDFRVLDTIAKELILAIQNSMRFEEIQNFNITLQQKIDEATRKMKRTNEKLLALDEAKDDFISMASHQLRTPLTSVKGYISMVLEGDAGHITRTQREMLDQAFFSSQRMVYLISDLLNISRLKTGKFVIEPTPVNLAEIVEQELGQLEETAASRQLTLTYQKPDNFPILPLDETKTRQVIMNFVDNAIYYTPPGGHITVKLVDNPHTVELSVTDNGIGVPKSEQHHLFTKFYRAGNARKARPDGTGLGLFMAKKVIVAQHGSLIFESQENKGSTFGFVIAKSKLTTV